MRGYGAEYGRPSAKVSVGYDPSFGFAQGAPYGYGPGVGQSPNAPPGVLSNPGMGAQAASSTPYGGQNPELGFADNRGQVSTWCQNPGAPARVRRRPINVPLTNVAAATNVGLSNVSPGSASATFRTPLPSIPACIVVPSDIAGAFVLTAIKVGIQDMILGGPLHCRTISEQSAGCADVFDGSIWFPGVDLVIEIRNYSGAALNFFATITCWVWTC